MTTRPFLHIEMDVFLNMMPERYLDHPDGISFVQGAVEGRLATEAKSGRVAEQVLTGMRQSIAKMAEAGSSLVIDDVLFGNTDQGDARAYAEYRRLLKPFRFKTVGVFASLETLEARELARGDRVLGLARWQFDRVHEGMSYDLDLSTDDRTPAECAQEIAVAFDL